MKPKVLGSLLLASVMLFTLVVPVLADRAAGTLNTNSGVTGTGKYSIRTTHDNRLKVTVSLRGANATSEYVVMVGATSLGYFKVAGNFTTNTRGSGRFSGFATIDGYSNPDPKTFGTGDVTFLVSVHEPPATAARFQSPGSGDTVHFK